MEMNLKAFMKPELKDREPMVFPGIEKFKDEKTGKAIPFVIKRLSAKDIKEIRDIYKTAEVFRDKKNGGRPMVENGQIVMKKEYDAERAGLHIMVDAFVQPKLDDPELMKYYGVIDRLDMPEIIFADREDYRYANECVMIACGLKDPEPETETVDKIKN